jgi:hypothetical protein
MALQIRRGPTTDRNGKTFAEGELVFDTTEKALYIGDGSTVGGKSASTYTDGQATDAAGALLNGATGNVDFTYNAQTNALTANVTLDGGLLDVVADTSPQLGGNLDLNSRNITGTGNVNITGSVTATSFSGPLTGNVTGSVSGNAGTVTNGIYTNHNFYIGTEQISITRASSPLTLNGVSISGNAGGNAATATKLAATANINGVAFDGSASITIADSTKLPLTGGTISSDLIITGNLTVNGTTTTLNVATLDIEDLNITVAKGALNASAANGAGLTVDGANASLLYASTGDKFVFNKPVDASGFNGNLTGTVQTAAQTNITSVGTLTGLTSTGIVNINYTGSSNTSVVIGGSNTKGGAGFHDFLSVTNGADSISNPNKYFRLNSTGDFEIVNSAYSTTILILTDSGNLTVPGTVTAPDGFIGDLTGNVTAFSGTSTFNSIVVNDISGTNPEATITINNAISSTKRLKTVDEIMCGTDDFNFSLRALPEFVLLGRPLAVFNGITGVHTVLEETRASFGVPVQFGRYTTSQRNALSTVIAVTGATGTGTVVTLTFNDQPQEIFDVGASITVTDIVSQTGNYNGTFTVTASTKFSVSYAHTASGVYGAPGSPVVPTGAIAGPVPNGTVVYDKDLQKFYGYAGGAWFQFAAAV